MPESSGSTEKADAERSLKQRVGEVASGPFPKFKPIVEILAMKLDAPVTPYAWDGSFGDQVPKCGLAPADVLGRRRDVQQTVFVPIQSRSPGVKTIYS